MRTIAQQLFRSIIPGILLILLLGGVLLHSLISERLNAEFDRNLLTNAQALMATTEQDEDGVELEVYHFALPSYSLEEEPDYFEILDSNGEVLFQSPSLEGHSTLHQFKESTGPEFTDIKLLDGRPGRLVRHSYYARIDLEDDDMEVDDESLLTHKDELEESSQENSDIEAVDEPPGYEIGSPVVIGENTIVPELLTVHVATSREPLDQLITSLRMVLLLTGLVTTSLIVLLLRQRIRRTVRPLEFISQRVGMINEDTLDQRLELTEPIQEFHVLASQFNVLLERLQSAFVRERRFSSDVAHELRTPLAELRTLVEVSARWPEDKSLKANFYSDIEISSKKMQRIVETLLALSRSEMGIDSTSGKVDLTALINQIVSSMQHDADIKDIQFESDLPDSAVYTMGQDHWPLIMNNLIDNAIHYSPEGSTIRIGVNVPAGSQRFEVAVSNQAVDLLPADLDHMFDRLWRKDKARSAGMHSGLGLSLVKAYSERLGFSIRPILNEQGEFTMMISGETLVEDQVLSGTEIKVDPQSPANLKPFGGHPQTGF